MVSFRHWSISRKILLGIVPLFILFIALSVALNNHFQEREMMEQAQLAAHTYADIIRESLVSMMVNNLHVDESFLGRTSLLQPFDTLHILVNDLKLRPEVVNEQNAHRIPTEHRSLTPHDDFERMVLKTGEPRFIREGDRFRGIVPFNATNVCQKCHAVPVGYTLGAADLHISFTRISRAARDNWERSFLIFIGFTFLAILVATVMFRRFVTKPVDRLVQATAAISAGNLDYKILPGHTRGEPDDELAFLSVKFDAMRESLKEKISQLDVANRALAERNEQLEQALNRLQEAQKELVRTERLAVTGKMTAQLSHEINNPIHNIQSLLESSYRKTSGTAKELIALALEEVTRMAKLTRQMLDFYRGSMVEFERLPVDMQDVLEHLLKENAPTLEDHNVVTSLSIDNNLPLVLGSRDKLKQVFLNLVLNARDAMPEGGALRIVAEPQDGNVTIRVSDTGIGIPPENLNKIFDAFFTTKKEVSGVGLGLSVTYGIVQQHNGSIRVESEPGKGTTFTIELPAVRQPYE